MVRMVTSHLSRSRPAVTFVLLAILATLTLPLPAHAKNWSGGLRLGTAQEGPQGTLKSGFELGAVLDRTAGGAFDFGVGIGMAMDDGTESRPSTRIYNFEGHARSSTVHRPVYLELGLGWYWVDHGSPSAGLPDFGTKNGVGGFLGAGYEWRATESMRIGLGATYHMMAAELPGLMDGSGNMEDYFAIGATFRW